MIGTLYGENTQFVRPPSNDIVTSPRGGSDLQDLHHVRMNEILIKSLNLPGTIIIQKIRDISNATDALPRDWFLRERAWDPTIPPHPDASPIAHSPDQAFLQ